MNTVYCTEPNVELKPTIGASGAAAIASETGESPCELEDEPVVSQE